MIQFNFYKPEQHLRIGLALTLLFAFCYIIPNQLGFFRATPVPQVLVDQMIPFQVEWIWFYLITYPFVVGVYFFALEGHSARVFVNSYILVSVCGAVAFFFYPTTIIRELYAINPDHNLSARALYYFQFLDKPTNCIPSFHIALTFITSASLFLTGKKRGILGIILGLLIAYSTMAVKQHYFLDVFSGFILGLCAFSFMFFSLRRI